METRQWLNRSLPQTLFNASLLLYLNAGFAFLFGGFTTVYGLITIVGGVAAGYGIANEKRWGYQLGLVVAFLPFVVRFLFGGLDAVLGTGIINLMFEILLVALLLHQDSKQHQKVWFS